MDSGMARTFQGTHQLAGGSIVILSAVLLGTLAWGQDNPAAPTASHVPFSKDCQIGDLAVATQSALPNVAAALRLRKQIKILAFGTSSSAKLGTMRRGHTEETRQILQRAITGLNVTMVNRGVGGELASQAAERIQNEVALNEPDMIIWQVGTEDALAYTPLAELETTITDTVRWLKQHNVDVVLVGLQYVDRMERDEHYRAVRQLLNKISTSEKDVMVVRRYEAQRQLAKAQLNNSNPFQDEFERSEAGYVCLAQYLAQAITIGIFGERDRPPPNRNFTRPPGN